MSIKAGEYHGALPWPIAQSITLSEDDRATLTAWARRPKTAQALALRARIVLAVAIRGATNTAVAARLGVTMPTVTKRRNRFAASRLDGLHDEPRSGAKRTITVLQEAESWTPDDCGQRISVRIASPLATACANVVNNGWAADVGTKRS